MKKTSLLSLLFLAAGIGGAQAQELKFSKAKFHVGDNMEWGKLSADDSQWRTLSVLSTWSGQGVSNPNNYAWYRIKFVLPESMRTAGDVKNVLRFDMGKIDDADETYLNGVLIGKTGRMPADKGGYSGAFDTHRLYVVNTEKVPVNWGKENVLAVRVYNGGEPGGMFGGQVVVTVPSKLDGLKVHFGEAQVKGKQVCRVTLDADASSAQSGKLAIKLVDPQTGTVVSTQNVGVSMKKSTKRTIDVPYDLHQMQQVSISYTDKQTGRSMEKTYIPKYILTPAAPLTPRYNGPAVFGVRPGSPVIYRIPVSGERPMKFSIDHLPEGLKLDAANGIISGSLNGVGEYRMTIHATNAKGSAEAPFSIVVGSTIALTPPMGWNSWNCWGLSVSQQKVISSAQAIIDKGLADYGYNYINVDDAWESAKRNADGTISTNEKFPDMKGLGDWLHSHGLKFGIYSSPGDRTCGQYLGSLDHEKQDAEVYNSWGVDYLKYDWCGYSKVFDKDPDKTVAAYVRPYLLMEKYLREQPRDIFYSLCQYGMADVWKWGHAVDANSWRTTGDITDTWNSLYDIGFMRQAELAPYAQPGHWNDPDMLIVGKVGWSANLRDSRLTPDEQYTHITLWTLLASNMLIGCDVAQIDDFTLSLLCNNEVNAVNQDVLGKQAKPEVIDGEIQIWKRPLADGSYAVGIFNLGLENTKVDFAKYLPQLGIKSLKSCRDLWRQKDISTTDLNYFIPTHGTKYIKITY